MFWTRFGTSTDKYESGTEEEIEIMLADGKQVFMYFSDKPIIPSQYDSVQYAKIQAFREKYKDRGVYFTYSSDEEFEKMFFAHLSQHFLSEKRVSEIQLERKPKLLLKGIDEKGNLIENTVFQKYDLTLDTKLDEIFEEIKVLFSTISNIHLQPRIDACLGVDSPLSLNKAVEIDEKWISLIKFMSEQLKIELNKDFFDLGNLSKPVLLDALYGDSNYEGTDAEKEKYQLIKALFLKIEESYNWLNVVNGFKDVMCVKLALANIGTYFDEDIDVTLYIPVGFFRSIEELPTLTEETMRFLYYECDMQSILGIPATATYNEYDSSIKETPHSITYGTEHSLPGMVDYEEEYLEELENVFCYNVYFEKDCFVIKLKFDYIKHNSTVAFPAAIFLNEKPDFIRYEITSKNSVKIISGQIIVE